MTNRIEELERLAKTTESLSHSLDGARYNKETYMALYDVRAALKRLGYTDYGQREPLP